MFRSHSIFLIFIIIVICILHSTNLASVSKNYNKAQEIRTLVRQASRWSAASEQDKSVAIALLHANYGAGFLWALKDIATDNEIQNATGLDIIQFTKTITDIQDKATQNLSKRCPFFTKDLNKYLLTLGY